MQTMHRKIIPLNHHPQPAHTFSFSHYFALLGRLCQPKTLMLDTLVMTQQLAIFLLHLQTTTDKFYFLNPLRTSV